MQKIHVNLLKIGILLWIPVLMVCGCTGKNDIVLELDTQENVQEDAQVAKEEPVSSEIAQAAEEEPVSSEIYVHICGAVINPGVYALAPDCRVFEGIAAAGGFREDACEDCINQAMPLQDGQRLNVPTEEEVQKAKEEGTYQEGLTAGGPDGSKAAGEAAFAKDKDSLVNINTATEAQLSAIPGIGAGKAAAIVTYRQENGAFASTEDIMKVSGIKEGTYEKIKDKITVN